MSESPRNQIWTAVLAALVLMAGAGITIVVVNYFTNSQLILGLLGLAGAIVTAAYQYRMAKDKETEARLFSEKQAVYTELIATIMGLFHSPNAAAEGPEQDKLVRKLQDIRTKLIVWGSFKTLHSVDQMSQVKAQGASNDPVSGMILWLGGLFSAIRRDLGHKDPPEAGREIALGILKEPDREHVRILMS